MTPDQPDLWNDPQIQARIVAWIAGEASDFEISELEELLAESPELKMYHARMLALHDRLKAMGQPADEPWTIEKEKRKALLETLGAEMEEKESQENPPSRVNRWITWGGVGLAASVALVGVFGWRMHEDTKPLVPTLAYFHKEEVLLKETKLEQPAGAIERLSSRRVVQVPSTDLARPDVDEELEDSEGLDVSESLAVLGDHPIRTNPALSSQHSGVVDEIRKELYKAEGAYNLGDFDTSEEGYLAVLGKDKDNKAARRGLEKVAQAKSEYYRSAYDQTRASLLAEVDSAWELTVPGQSGGSFGRKRDEALQERQLGLDDASQLAAGGFVEVEQKNKKELGFDWLVTLPELTAFEGSTDPDVSQSGEGTAFAGVVTDGNRTGDSTADAILNHQDRTSREHWAFYSLPEAKEKEVTLVAPATVAPAKKLKPQLGRIFKSEISASHEAFSTFSLNVSDVSFQLASAAIQSGGRPAPESVRVEEFVNAFDYGDALPKHGQPVACVIEQSIHPFLQQRNLFRIGVRTAAAGRGQGVPLSLTVLLDQSGSMERADRQEALQAGMRVLVDLLKEGDQVSVIGFSRTPRLLADRVKGTEREVILNAVKLTPSEGGTNLEKALTLARETARRQFQKGGQNRIVLITDGAANLGNAQPAALAGVIQSLRAEGIAFDACGVSADDLNDELLEEMARQGDGRYYLLDRAGDADLSFARQLAGAFRPAAENVKVQVVFNPQRVGNYQLMGYEKHRLQKEDFRDDMVDAAELAAEESGVALYHAGINPEGQGEVGQLFVRFRDTATGVMVERQWVIPYQPQPRSFDQAPASLQLAAVAACVGEALAESPLGQQVDFQSLTGVMSSIRRAYPKEPRIEELSTMLKALKN